jgi:hypothetical protein
MSKQLRRIDEGYIHIAHDTRVYILEGENRNNQQIQIWQVFGAIEIGYPEVDPLSEDHFPPAFFAFR